MNGKKVSFSLAYLLGWMIKDHRCVDFIECIPFAYSYVVFRVSIMVIRRIKE